MQNRIVIFDLDGTIYQNSVFHRGYLRTLVAGTWAEPLEADLVRLAEAIFAGRKLDMNRFYRRGRAEAATVPELVQALRKRVLPNMTYAEALQADDVVYLGDAWAVLAYLGDALGCLDGDRANEVYRLTRLQMEMAAESDLCAMKPYELRSYLDYAEDPDGCCTLAIHAEDPEALAGLDAGKLNRVNLARRTFMKPWQAYTMNDRVQWCVAAVPAPGWAAKVFPDLPLEEAIEKLWALIFDVCRVSTGDPVTAWKEHVARTKARRDRMNELNLDRIHMTSANGTDLTVGLAEDATWEGASSKTEGGIEFIANVPTEEVFCAPHRDRVDGRVYGTKPYAYNGQLIEGWHVTFQNGKVVEHGAEKNAELLAELLTTDENANRIGEIALVPASSPINRSGVLFYNTLFDENAACHIAFGDGYPTNIKGGSAMSRDELLAKGLNSSAIHEDVMVGAPDTHVVGVTKSGEEITIFENGEWAF